MKKSKPPQKLEVKRTEVLELTLPMPEEVRINGQLYKKVLKKQWETYTVDK
jgi:hypothetical protein